ncbi:hypothetical protein TNCV_1776811 [Trichonephila clavipes]|nr:hypothetical protein TNCV_1776811 [Trichonephila clavipes]
MQVVRSKEGVLGAAKPGRKIRQTGAKKDSVICVFGHRRIHWKFKHKEGIQQCRVGAGSRYQFSVKFRGESFYVSVIPVDFTVAGTIAVDELGFTSCTRRFHAVTNSNPAETATYFLLIPHHQQRENDTAQCRHSGYSLKSTLPRYGSTGAILIQAGKAGTDVRFQRIAIILS